MAKAWIVGAAGFVLGAAAASGAWTAFPPSKPVTTPVVTAERGLDDSALVKANANLTASLHECDRRLAELGERPVGTPSAAPSTAAPADSGRGRGRSRAPLTSEDWERMAESGVVPIRIPCIRDKPWEPNERAIDRLGLAPSDVDVLKNAYAASNKRMADEIKPLCAKVLGGAEAADKVGASSCIDVINSSARKSSADETKAALARVAEVQAGKRQAPAPGADIALVEQLGLALTRESKRFEDDLAQHLGPEEAKRLAAAPELCSERKMLRAGDVDPSVFGGDGRQRGGRRTR